MRYILVFLLVCFSSITFSQMSLDELKKLQKMNLSKIENYCLGKGFKFSQVYDDEFDFGISYVKGIGSSKVFINFYERYVKHDYNVVVYQTNSSSDYLSIKTQIEESGFILVLTSTDNGVMFKEYTDANFIVILATGKDPELHQDAYEITLKPSI